MDIFVCNGTRQAFGVIKNMFTCFQTTSILELGLDRCNWLLLIIGIAILVVVDVIREKGISIFSVVLKQEAWFRWIIYLVLLWLTIMFGIYGKSYDTSTFIYFQF